MIDARRQGILFVCTGNICRSPYLEIGLRSALRGSTSGGLPIVSAGTRAEEGRPMSAVMAGCFGDRDVSAAGFRSRRLTATMVESAAVVLTATRDHRTSAVRLDPASAERVFTVVQFARLLGSAPTTSARQPDDPGSATLDDLIARALLARGRSAGGEDDDIEDPWRRSRRVHRRAAARMDDALEVIATCLRSA